MKELSIEEKAKRYNKAMRRLFKYTLVLVICFCVICCKKNNTTPQTPQLHNYRVTYKNGYCVDIEASRYAVNPDNLNAYFYDSNKNNIACVRDYITIILIK